jgi:RNA polymerase sigma factor (sigma-70 family)
MPILLGEKHRRKTSNMPDSRAQLAAGDVAFREHYRRLYGRARHFAASYVGAFWAEDIVDEAFLDLWDAAFAEGNVPASTQDTLFYRILRCRIVDKMRAAEREAIRDADQDNILSISSHLANQTDAAMVAEGTFLAGRMDYIIESLPMPRRRVLQIAKAHDWNPRVAANEMGITYETARWHLRRAVEQLRQTLEQDGYAVPAKLPLGRRGRRHT